MCSQRLPLYIHFTPVWEPVQPPKTLKMSLNKLFKNKSGVATYTVVVQSSLFYKLQTLVLEGLLQRVAQLLGESLQLLCKRRAELGFTAEAGVFPSSQIVEQYCFALHM